MARRMFTLVGASLGALLLIAVSAAYAADDRGGLQDGWQLGWLDRADADRNGAISSQEALSLLQEPFISFDRNGDGVLSEAEVRATIEEAVDRIVERVVRRFDADRDGKITKDEFDRFTRERFSWLDFTVDGKNAQDESFHVARRMVR